MWCKKPKPVKPRVIIFASGTQHGGGSCLLELLKSEKDERLDAEIVAVVSNHEWGGARIYALQFHKRFEYFTGPFTARNYARIVKKYNAEWVMLSGWLKPFLGGDPRKIINSHPALLPEFGGKGMYGLHVHEKVIDAYHRGEIEYSAFSMHFVIDDRYAMGDFYDKGPVFFESPPILLRPFDDAFHLQDLIKIQQHVYEWQILNFVIHGEVRWENVNDRRSIIVPKRYEFLPRSMEK